MHGKPDCACVVCRVFVFCVTDWSVVVQDAMQRPISVVSLTDVLRIVDQRALHLQEKQLQAAEAALT